MFTGIVTSTGSLARIEMLDSTRRLWIEAPQIASELRAGGSVAVDGACLTATVVEETNFTVDVHRHDARTDRRRILPGRAATQP